MIGLIITIAALIIAWFVVERFAPDPLLALICKVIIFVIAVIKLLPLLGVSL